MADKNGSGQKDKPPTWLRLRQARRDGDVAKSRELTQAVGLLVGTLTVLIESPMFVGVWRQRLEVTFAVVPTALTPDRLINSLVGWTGLLSLTTAAVLAPAAVAGFAVGALQTGLLFAPKKLSPDFTRLNPAGWFQRAFRVEGLVEILKSFAKLGLAILIGRSAVEGALNDVARLPYAGPGGTLMTVDHVLTRLFVSMAVVMIGVGVIDYLYQRFMFLKNMKMTLRDVRHDRKTMEGDPQIKGRRRHLYREWSNHNAAEAARGATVIVTNPTHFAVALTYDPAVHSAPCVAAKGQDSLAATMREAAAEAGVPIIRNPTLARELFARTDIDEQVPEDMFMAVAEVIVWASRLRHQGAAE
jgi:type III secretion protein U